MPSQAAFTHVTEPSFKQNFPNNCYVFIDGLKPKFITGTRPVSHAPFSPEAGRPTLTRHIYHPAQYMAR